MNPVNLADYEALAREKLSSAGAGMAWDYMAGGAEDEITVAENCLAFRRIKFRPRVLVDASDRDLSTTVLGHKISLPVMLTPTSAQILFHPQAELAVTRAASAIGTIFVPGNGNHYSIEEVAAASSRPLWFQFYCYNNRDVITATIRRAEAAGCQALVLTVDSQAVRRHERALRNPLVMPAGAALPNLMNVGLRDDLMKPDGGSVTRASYRDFVASLVSLAMTWGDIDWIISITKLPVILKGIMTAEDAILAVAHGAAAIVVSNHGGRQLDGTLATIEMLPEIVNAVGGQVEILLDGGIRRGTDILKALALGARAVLIGRPYLWGLTVDGEAGVYRVLEMLRDELWIAMAQAGQPDVKRVDRHVVTYGSGSLGRI